MSFGAGHIQDMNNRLKHNRSQRPSKKSKFKENSRSTLNSDKSKANSLIFKKASTETLLELKSKSLKEAKKNNIKNILIASICLLIIGIVFLIVLAFL